MRLPNGYGTVYKLSGKRRLPFIARITVGWDNEGKQILKTVGYYKNKQEGLRALADYHKNPYDIDYNKLTFLDIWRKIERELEEKVQEGKMTQSNIEGLSFAFKNHLQELHQEKLSDIKYRQMQEIINNSVSRNNKPLSYSGKGYMKTVCVKIYDYAIDYLEMPVDNIARKLKVGTKPSSDKHKPFTEEEIETLWNNQQNDLVKITLIWLYTGLRPNELFKTERENIYLDDDYFITGSKTEAGKNRIVPIHKKIKAIMEYFYLRKDLFNIFDKTDYNKIKREFNKLMDAFDMEHTPYDCRHTFITKMKKANANEYLLKRIVGHSIQDLTENTYTHRDIKELVDEVQKIS